MASPQATAELDQLMARAGIQNRTTIDVWIGHPLEHVVYLCGIKGIEADEDDISLMILFRLVERNELAYIKGGFASIELVN